MSDEQDTQVSTSAETSGGTICAQCGHGYFATVPKTCVQCGADLEGAATT
jgi:uncharacterized protein (DUF983 family)